MRRDSISVFEERAQYHCDESRHLFLSFKYPLHNRGKKVIGTYGLSVDVIDKSLEDVATLLNLLMMQGQSIHSEQIKRFLSLSEINGVTLSGQETRCVYCLTRGLSIKAIAALLKLASKTVEGYLANVKIKTNCPTRNDLIFRALNSGFPYTHHFPIF